MSAFSGGGGGGSLRPPNVPAVLLTFSIHFRKGARLPSVTVSLARERSDGAGGGCGRGYPPPMVGTFSKIRVSKLHFKALLKRFSRELNVIKIHGKELGHIFFRPQISFGQFSTHRIGVPIDDRTSPTSLTSKTKKECCTRSHIYITAFFAGISSLLGYKKISRGCCAPTDLQHPQHPRFPGPWCKTATISRLAPVQV